MAVLAQKVGTLCLTLNHAEQMTFIYTSFAKPKKLFVGEYVMHTKLGYGAKI